MATHTSESGTLPSNRFPLAKWPNCNQLSPIASQVFNSHSEQTPHRSSKKSDSLCKLYEMDDNPERRGWLDKLLSFMEERRTPISACPTISKQPLDLFKLYILVKDRGGFVEVCKVRIDDGAAPPLVTHQSFNFHCARAPHLQVTKSKTWKEIASSLGIGGSSSAAYTLRKHYTKNLLAFECHYDRGGIDPLPIIQQVEAGSKKKTTKAAASIPSPGESSAGSQREHERPMNDRVVSDANHKGSSNSQDSFPAPGSSSTSMDGYNAYPAGYPPPSSAGPNYNETIQRPPSQATQQAPPQTGSCVFVGDEFRRVEGK